MKNRLFILLALIGTTLFASRNGVALKPFEGIITYKISYPGRNISESQKAVYPQVLKVMIRGMKSRVEYSTPAGQVVIIMDFGSKTQITLLNFMGQKYALKETADEIENATTGKQKPTIQFTTETKLIAGFLCKKALINFPGDQDNTGYEIYYSHDLGGKLANMFQPMYKEINGAMLDYAKKTPQGVTRFTATSIERTNVSGKEFEIPSDYIMTTSQELKKKTGNTE